MKIKNKDLPKLRYVSRPAAWNTLVLGFFNIAFAYSLWTIHVGVIRNFFIVNQYTSLKFWAVTYFLTGLGFIGGYAINNWSIMRNINILALFVKLFWITALILNEIQTPGSNPFVTVMLVCIALMQLGHYLYFPTSTEATGPLNVGNVTIPKEILK